MHNTYISLDMIFIRGDGRILSIAANTEPLSDKPDALRRPGAGGAGGDRRYRRKLGIAPGDRVAGAIFSGRR